jgi:hypothetical protein
MNNQIYFENFTCIDDMMGNFCISQKDLEGCEIIYASYDCPPYEGYAHVIFIKDKKLYEVNGSHCSCNDLGGQWIPEETSLAALMFRPNVSDFAKANLKKRFRNLIAFL